MARAAAVASTVAPRVNLLPPSEVARRERERLAGRWTWVVITAVIVSALLIGAAWAWNQFAQAQLAAEQNRTDALIAEVASLSDVSSALNTEEELTGFLAEAMGSDLSWTDVRTKVESALPADVTLAGFDVIPGPPASQKLTEEAAVDVVGLHGTITLDSPNALDIAAISRQLRTVGAVADSDSNAVAESTVVQGRYTYTIDVTFDQAIYSGRFAIDEKGGE